MKRKPSLSVTFCGQEFSNPLVLASGILGTEAELMARLAKTGIGAVTTKSCCLKPRAGHENPTVLAWEHGLINAVGLTNPGVEKEIEDITHLRSLLKKSQTKIIASFFGGTTDEFIKVAERLATAKPDFLEANISCPNVESDFGQMFAASCPDTAKIVKGVKQVTDIPLIVKLSPNVTDIKSIALTAQEAGADALNGINTLLGMVIDLKSGRPILTNKMGGVSGPAIRPVAVRCVYQMAQACKIPIIGLGGITSGHDAIEMVMAGATLVGIGSAVYEEGMEIFTRINQEMLDFMNTYGYTSLDQIKGKAHEN